MTNSPAPGASTTSRERAAILICGLSAGFALISVGTVRNYTIEQWLLLAIAVATALWIGGAVSGQILLARALDVAPPEHVTIYLRQLLWIIPRVYVPLGLVAVGAGIWLLVRSPEYWADPAVQVVLGLYVITAIAGSAVSAPGYVRIMRSLENDRDIAAKPTRARLIALAWLNRVELVLVVGVGCPLLVSLA